MYTRIQDKHIKYRISKQEAIQLADGEVFHDSISLSVVDSLNYAIELTEQQNKFEYDKHSNTLSLFINQNSLTQELTNRPTKKGIVFRQQFGEKEITVSLEIDVKKK